MKKWMTSQTSIRSSFGTSRTNAFWMFGTSQGGQVMAGVLILLSIMAILVPVMVYYVQRESQWTSKQAHTTTAFHLAEAGIEKAYNVITVSTGNWATIQKGNPLTGFNYDTAYTDIPGGTYSISITQGPGKQQATIISAGRDPTQKEVRAIKAVYTNSPLGNVAIYGGSGVQVTGSNMGVEWGAIISPNAITTGGKLHPQFWSAGSIDLDANGAAPPNCDSPNCCFWHSYSQNIPPQPAIDFNFYKSSAIASGTGPGTCGNYYQPSGNSGWTCTDLSGNPYYFGSDVTFNGGHIRGAVIVRGNFSTSNGSLGGAAETDDYIPQTAWKQYCNDWATYQGFGVPGTPATFPGLNSTYLSPANYNYNVSPVVHGLLYVDGDFTGPNGGGNSTICYGVLFIKGNVFLNSNSHVHFYYGGDAVSNLQTTNLVLSRVAWQDMVMGWPGP